MDPQPVQQPHPSIDGQTPPPTAPVKKPDIDFGNPLDEEKVLLSWKSPERLHKKRGKEFYTTIAAFVLLLSIIAMFFREFLAMVAVWAIAFVSVVMSRTEPEIITNSIGSRGIASGKNKYRWHELARFWFEEKWGTTMLCVNTFQTFPGRLIILLGDTPKERVKEILVKKIPYDKPEDTLVDRASKWIQEKIPLEEETRKPVAPSTK